MLECPEAHRKSVNIVSTYFMPTQPPITFSSNRLKSEFKTLTAMITIYCEAHHDSNKTLCANCQELLNYAKKRLANCPFQEKKPTCGKCPVHCYKKSMQDKVQMVMKYSGPRMVYRHPIMALKHLIDGNQKVPASKKT